MTYNELYPNSITDGLGLLSALSISNDIPWRVLTTEIKKSIEYAYNIRSGYKRVYSRFTSLSEVDRVNSIVSIYSEKWTKYWNLFKLEYDPLSAYIVTESGTRNKNFDSNRVTTYGKTENETTTDAGTVTNVGSNTVDEDNYVFGFNSTESVPSDESIGSEQNNNTETRNLTQGRNTTNSGSDTIGGIDVEDEEYKVSKSGNIGYSTPQKLISEEFTLWETPFFQMVFEDIDKFIMLKIYT